MKSSKTVAKTKGVSEAIVTLERWGHIFLCVLRCQTRLQQLSAATDTWREFEEARVQLASALEQDRRRLSLLETALSAGEAQPSDVIHTDVTDSGVSQLSGISEMMGADESREEEERRKQRMLVSVRGYERISLKFVCFYMDQLYY